MKKALLILLLSWVIGGSAIYTQQKVLEREFRELLHEKMEYEMRLAIPILIIEAELKAEQKKRDELFEKAIELIKKYETIHGPECYPYIGYGHLILPEDRHLSLPITEIQADSILRTDLNKKMAFYDGEEYEIKLLLGMLSYNVGQHRLIDYHGNPISGLAEMLLGDDEYDHEKLKARYTAYNKWNGKKIKSIERRRIEEFELIFDFT